LSSLSDWLVHHKYLKAAVDGNHQTDLANQSMEQYVAAAVAGIPVPRPDGGP